MPATGASAGGDGWFITKSVDHGMIQLQESSVPQRAMLRGKNADQEKGLREL
jgi:hypothetical protein